MTKEALSQPHGLTSAQAASTAIGEPWMHTHAVRHLEFTNCLHQEVISSILNKIEMPLSALYEGQWHYRKDSSNTTQSEDELRKTNTEQGFLRASA